MTIAPANLLSSHLNPLCSRDDHEMKYESGGSSTDTGNESSYHCGYVGCSVRYIARNESGNERVSTGA